MKNETSRNELKSSFRPNCVECDNCRPKILGGQGRTRTQLPNGQWSEETICNMYDIICAIDGKSKGKVFTPYENLEPEICPMHSQKKKIGLFRKIFQSFF